MELEMKISKKTWKRWLVGFLSICLCFSCLRLPVSAQEEQVKKDAKSGIARSYSEETVPDSEVTGIQELTLEEYSDVSITNEGDVKWFSFTASKQGTYYFYSENNEYIDTYGALYSYNNEDSMYQCIAENDDIYGDSYLSSYKGSGLDFCIEVEMEVGQTYYLATSLYESTETAVYKIKVSTLNPSAIIIPEGWEKAEELTVDTAYKVKISEAGEYRWYKLTAEKAKEYYFYSKSDKLIVGVLFKKIDGNLQYVSQDVPYWEDTYGFNIGTYTEESCEYYLYTSLYDQDAIGEYEVLVSEPKVANDIEVKEIKPYSSMLAYQNRLDNSYGQMTFEISYEGTNEKEEIVVPFDESYREDYFGNYFYVQLVNDNDSTSWRRTYQGRYDFEVVLYPRSFEGNPIKKNFVRVINSFKEYGKTATMMSYGQNMTVGGGTQIFEITAQENGNHVISYSESLQDSTISVYNASENRTNWKFGENNTRYGKLVKGNKYYVVVQSNSGVSGTIKMNYYNGATNPNAMPKPSTPSKPSTQNNTPAVNKTTGIPATNISVAKKNITVKKGGKIKLSTLVMPLNSTDQITFSSSKPKVVRVDNKGVVKAKKQGKAKITIRTTSGKTVVVTVNVKKNAIKATKVSMKKKLKVKAGTVRFLSYKVNPKNSTEKMKWKSSKKTVVAVDDNGKITAKKKGKAVITLKIGQKKASCKITVK